MFNLNPRVINSEFKKKNLEIRSNKINSRKYYYNESYFEAIDNPEKAYWLGFIYADGYIRKTKDQNVFGIAINTNDEEILHRLLESLNSNYEIKRYTTSKGYSNNTHYSRISIFGEKIVNDLIKHGVYTNKSNVLKAPNIEEKLIRHFIRGYLDGDGSIYYLTQENKVAKPRRDYRINFVGTDDVLTFIHCYFRKNKLINKELKLEKRKPNQIISNITYGGNKQVKRILDHLYLDSNIYLKRKYDKYIDMINYISPIQ